MEGNGKSKVEASDVKDPVDVFADRAFPGVVVSVGTDVKSEIPSGGSEGDIMPLRADVKDKTLARVAGEVPNWDDVGFGDVEFEVGCISNCPKGAGKRGEGSPEI